MTSIIVALIPVIGLLLYINGQNPPSTGLYFQLGSTIYLSGDTVPITDIGPQQPDRSDPGSTLACVTTNVNTQCCRGKDNPNGGALGNLFGPSGVLVPSFNSIGSAANSLYVVRYTHQLRLGSQGSPTGPLGEYTCAVRSGIKVISARITISSSIPTTSAITTASSTPSTVSTSLPTTTMMKTTMMSTTMELNTMEPTSAEQTTGEPTTVEPTTVEPTTREPTTRERTTREPTTMESTTMEPTTMEPTTREPTTREPSTMEPTTMEPMEPTIMEQTTTTMEPTTKEPTTMEITTMEQTTTIVEPNTMEPTSREPTTMEPTNMMSATMEQTTIITSTSVLTADEGEYSIKVHDCSNDNVKDEISLEMFQLIHSKFNVRLSGRVRFYPATSCDEIRLLYYDVGSGYYWIAVHNDTTLIYCQV